MDPRFACGQLDRNVDSAVKRLDQMLAQLQSYRPLLEQNVAYAAFEIRATFDSLMGALSQRQMQLLKQLDKIAKEKVGVIESQKQTIDNLRSNIVACMSNRNKNIGQIQEYLSLAESAVLSSSSAPFVSFRTEKPVMHQTISSYGRIVSQYCGHFADPSQPSSCLPRALEEEDDNDEPIDCSYNAQSMVFNRFRGPSNRIKSDLRQWLSEDHNVDREKYHCTEQKVTWAAMSDTLGLHPASESLATLKPVDSSLQTAVQSSFGICDPLLVRHWLDTSTTQKASEHPKGDAARKFSQAASFDSSDATESFVAFTGSTGGRLNSLKDWIFCDPLEFTGIPGLNSFKQPRSSFTSTGRFHKSLSDWLDPASAEQVTQSALQNDCVPINTSSNNCVKSPSYPAPLLPAHLIQSGPIDLNRWLASSSMVEPSSLQTNDDSITPVPYSDLSGLNETQTQSDTHSTASMDSPIQPATVRVEDESAPEGCIYSRCRGGPGGPTCCGGRKRLEAVENTIIHNSCNSLTITATQPDLVDVDKSSDGANITSGVNSAVVHLNSISKTPLSQWLAQSSNVYKESSVTLEKQVKFDPHTLDLSEWLQHTCVSNVSNDGGVTNHDSGVTISSSKRRLCSVTTDCLGCPCSGDMCPATTSQGMGKDQQSAKDCDPLDQWLLKKLSVC